MPPAVPGRPDDMAFDPLHDDETRKRTSPFARQAAGEAGPFREAGERRPDMPGRKRDDEKWAMIRRLTMRPLAPGRGGTSAADRCTGARPGDTRQHG